MSETKIVFWDVEHGHAAYLKAPNGRHIVIDLGTGSYGSGDEFSPLDHLKDQYGIKRLDYVIITHPHVDHIDDILNPSLRKNTKKQHFLRIFYGTTKYSSNKITYHAHRTWFDEDPSKGSKSIAIAADYNPIFRT